MKTQYPFLTLLGNKPSDMRRAFSYINVRSFQMKYKNILIGILAITLVFGMMVTGCDSDSVNDTVKDIVKKALSYTSVDSAGITYILTITGEGAGNMGAKGNTYELTIKDPSGAQTVSKGTIAEAGANGALKLQPDNPGSQTFDVTANNGQMTSISGTFTLTGIPEEYNGKYALFQGVTETYTVLYGAKDITNISSDLASATFTLCLISNGSLSIPMWKLQINEGKSKYSGNETTPSIAAGASISIVNTQTVVIAVGNTDLFYSRLGDLNVAPVTFANGSATKAWTDGTWTPNASYSGQ